MVERKPNIKASGQNFMNQSWVKILQEERIFRGDPHFWRITRRNCKQILQALNVNNPQFEIVLINEIAKHMYQLPFENFCKLYQKEFAPEEEDVNATPC